MSWKLIASCGERLALGLKSNIMELMWQTKLKHIIGTPDQSSWAQVHHFLPQKEEKLQARGELILLVSLKELESTQEPAVLGREVISRFHEEYFGQTNDKPMQALKNVLAKVGQEEAKFFPSPGQLSLVALVFWEDIVYLAIWDDGEIRLRRDMKTRTILKGKSEEPQVISGQAKQGDLYMLVTSDFIDQVPAEMLTASLSTEDLETIGEILTPVVHAQKKQGQLAAVFVKLLAEERKKNKAIAKSNLEEKKSDVKEKIKRPLTEKLKSKLPSIDIKKVIFSKASAIVIAIILLIVLSVSVYLGWQKQRRQKRQEKAQELSGQIEEKVGIAKQIRNLDPENSLKAVQEAEPIIEQLAEFDEQRANDWKNEVKNIKSGLGEKRIKPEIYYDLNLVADEVNVNYVHAVDEQVWILDQSGPRLIHLDLSEKKAEIVAGGENLKDQDFVVSTRTRQYAISQQKIFLLQGDELEEIQDLDEDLDLVSAGGWIGNLYLLDKNEQQIWKYPSITGSVGDARAWLRDNLSTEDEIVDMAIDGSIWVLTTDGHFYEYLSGEKQSLSLELPSGIGEAKYLTVSQEKEILAFWDEENEIVWLFNKEGQFQSRLPLDLDQVRGLSFSERADKLYIFADSKVHLLDNLSF